MQRRTYVGEIFVRSTVSATRTCSSIWPAEMVLEFSVRSREMGRRRGLGWRGNLGKGFPTGHKAGRTAGGAAASRGAGSWLAPLGRRGVRQTGETGHVATGRHFTAPACLRLASLAQKGARTAVRDRDHFWPLAGLDHSRPRLGRRQNMSGWQVLGCCATPGSRAPRCWVCHCLAGSHSSMPPKVWVQKAVKQGWLPQPMWQCTRFPSTRHNLAGGNFVQDADINDCEGSVSAQASPGLKQRQYRYSTGNGSCRGHSRAECKIAVYEFYHVINLPFVKPSYTGQTPTAQLHVKHHNPTQCKGPNKIEIQTRPPSGA